MRKTTPRRRAPTTDSYFELVQALPLRAIRTDHEHDEARDFLISTSMQHQGRRDQGVLDYIETLARLIESYEKQTKRGPDLSKLSAASAITHLMEVHGLNVTEMARMMGTTQGTLSEIRQGRRGVSKEMIKKLVHHFGVDATIFL